MKLNGRRNIWMFLITITAWGLCVNARADSCGPGAPCVVLGSDYLATASGTYITWPGIGVIDLMGNPIGPGNTDTIVQRTADATINGAAIPIQLTALSLESTAPVEGSTIYVTLDPDYLSSDTGTISINGTLAGGGFTVSSFFDVFVDICLSPGTGGVGCSSAASTIETGMVTLNTTGGAWVPTGPCLVTGPVGDLAADCHTGLDSNQDDFFLPTSGLVVNECASGPCNVVFMNATTPEPSTLILLGTALAGFVGVGWRKLFS